MKGQQSKHTICYIQYTNPAAYPPLEHSSRILANQGWEVLFVGTGSSGHADNFQFPLHSRIQVRRWQHMRPGWGQKSHFILFCLWALWQCLRNHVEWIYASDLLACPAALLASKLLNCKVIYHEHDSPPLCGSTNFHRLLATRHALCQKAKAVILPNSHRSVAFATVVKPVCSVLTVWNCPARSDALLNRTRSKVGRTLFYHGSINKQRLPLSVVRALALLPKSVRLEFAGYTTDGSRGYVEELLIEADRLGVKDRVAYLGAFSRYDLLPLCARSDIGLAFMPLSSDDINMLAMTGASNKPFEYMACGLNLLVSDLPDWYATFVEPGYARACNPADATSIAQGVQWFLDHPVEAETARVQGRQRILDDWNYETQFAPVLRVLTNPPPA